MQSWGLTDPGCVRPQNQDAFHMEQLDRNTLLCIVCDGMGGAKSGNIASSLASEVFVEEIKRSWMPDMEQDKIDQMLLSAVKLANFTVFDQAQQFEEFDGMGTTLVAVLTVGKTVYTVNVGDSRMYIVHGGQIEQITHDHSYVQYLVDMGRITAEEARTAQNRNIITRAVGTESSVDADVFVTEIDPAGNAVYALLCSDGLTNHIGENELAQILCADSNVSAKADTLVSRANNYGGTDNITAVVIKLENC
mgnify:CR=1 FL=1